MADEALSSFTSLIESVPGWIADMESILKGARERQTELLFEHQPADRPIIPPRKASMSASIKSSRSKKDDGGGETKAGQKDEDPAQSQPTLLKQQVPHMTPSDALRLSQRKRKTTSARSAGSNRSGPTKYRSRAMVVVYYDGDIQKRFETMVRAIGTCRHAVRKGKMGAKVDGLSRTGSSSGESSSSGGEEPVLELHSLSYKTTRPKHEAGGLFGRKGDASEVFDKVDGLLEKCQALCERAAHQILRDGDCAFEFRNAKEMMAEAKRCAESELPSLKKRAEKEAERQRRSEEARRAEEEERRQKQSNEAAANEKLSELVPTFPLDTKLEVDNVEVDDDSEEEEDFDFNALTMPAGKYQMTTPRLAA